MPVDQYLNPDGTPQAVTSAFPLPVTLGSGASGLVTLNGVMYETVAANAANQVLGGAGAIGDYLDGLLIIPGLAACGAVSIKDGGGAVIPLFAGGGVTALPSLVPFFVPLGIKSIGGAWSVTTGANVSAIGMGTFT